MVLGRKPQGDLGSSVRMRVVLVFVRVVPLSFVVVVIVSIHIFMLFFRWTARPCYLMSDDKQITALGLQIGGVKIRGRGGHMI